MFLAKFCIPLLRNPDHATLTNIGSAAAVIEIANGHYIHSTAKSTSESLAIRAGFDPARYAGHSLRSGFLISAATNGASIFGMADQSRHRSLDVLRQYFKD